LIIALLLLIQLRMRKETPLIVVDHFGAAAKCWTDAKPFSQFFQEEIQLRNSTGNEDSSICKRQKRLLREPLIESCDFGKENLDAGDCVLDGSKVVRCLPSFVVAGAMKSGTGALLRWMKRHPHIEVNIQALYDPSLIFNLCL
jgi:hypothetical protein